MKKDDIEIGKTYLISTWGIGKGLVKEGPSKRGLSNVYSFLVERTVQPDNQKREIWVEARNISREWMSSDDAAVEINERNRVRMEELGNVLTFAGYPEAHLQRRRDGYWLAFNGEEAKRVFGILTGQEIDAKETKA